MAVKKLHVHVSRIRLNILLCSWQQARDGFASAGVIRDVFEFALR